MNQRSNRQIKALFFDVDGTLVGYNSHRIHPSDMETLEILHRRGIKLFIASGRDFKIHGEAQVLDPVRHLIDGFISINGQHSELADGTVISSYFMDEEDFRRIQKFSADQRCPLLYYYGEETFATEMTDRVLKFSDYVNIQAPKIRPLSMNEPVPRKVCIYISEADDRNLLRPLMKHTYSANNRDLLSDLIPSGIGKETGLRDMCAHFGFSLSDTVAFGDGTNDSSMLRSAGIGIAMGIAPQEVRDAADYVTDTAENAGITLALKHFEIL